MVKALIAQERLCLVSQRGRVVSEGFGGPREKEERAASPLNWKGIRNLWVLQVVKIYILLCGLLGGGDTIVRVIPESLEGPESPS